MQQPVNLNEITDLKELKAMAYDQMTNKELAERNLAAINARIAQVAPAGATTTTEPAEPTDTPE